MRLTRPPSEDNQAQLQLSIAAAIRHDSAHNHPFNTLLLQNIGEVSIDKKTAYRFFATMVEPLSSFPMAGMSSQSLLRFAIEPSGS